MIKEVGAFRGQPLGVGPYRLDHGFDRLLAEFLRDEGGAAGQELRRIGEPRIAAPARLDHREKLVQGPAVGGRHIHPANRFRRRCHSGSLTDRVLPKRRSILYPMVRCRPMPMHEPVLPPDLAPDAAAIEAGRLLFAGACEFRAGAAREAALPPPTLPEIAFAGRSNVGKSSLLNALTGRRALARVSRTPGRTQQINFFALGGRLMLVDLPGYGHAEAAKRQIANWNRLVEHYLKGRAALGRVLLLIDARHGIKAADRPVLKLLDAAAQSYAVVLTKCDAVGDAALAQVSAATAAELARHAAAYPALYLTSAREGRGIETLRAALAELAMAVPGG
jgi:GTP-binding protein